MKKVMVLVLGALCCLVFVSSLYAAKLEKGESLFTRSNLHVKGDAAFWHNMSILKDVIPVGTEVKVINIGSSKIIFGRTDDKKNYALVIGKSNWDKYFVREKNEIGLERFSAERRSLISKGEVVVGMTKEEAYASKGCPAYIKWGGESYACPFSEIMQSDTWYYLKNSRDHGDLIKFDKGVVTSVGKY
jgi:hypothetical protein